MTPCLYCKQDNTSFTSEEHVIPEGLGNHELVLPKGVVCDRCNNGKLSALDQTLMNFAPISAMKTLHGVPSKTGALPKGKFGNARLEMFAPGNVLFESTSRKAFRHKMLADGTGRVSIDMQFLSNRPMGARYSRQLTRALLKMLLGCIYIDDEQRETKIALTQRFDPLREKILDRTKFRGYFGMPRSVQDPSRQGSGLEYAFVKDEAGDETIGLEFRFFGVTMFTDSEMLGLRHKDKVPGDQVGIFHF